MTAFTQLAATLDRISEVQVFFRDDDAGWADARLWELVQCFDGAAPLDLAVIPASMSTATADRLTGVGTWLGFHQHGFAHVNHESTGRKCEFGDSRRPAEIIADVSAGRARLLDLFGARLDPIFTPPWNRCAQATIDAMSFNGLTVLSRDLTASRLEWGATRQLPVTVDWVKHRSEIDARLARAFSAAESDGHAVGLMLHHEVLLASDLALLSDLLGLLDRHVGVETASMMSLSHSEVLR